jgi:hypothetical protein
MRYRHPCGVLVESSRTPRCRPAVAVGVIGSRIGERGHGPPPGGGRFGRVCSGVLGDIDRGHPLRCRQDPRDALQRVGRLPDELHGVVGRHGEGVVEAGHGRDVGQHVERTARRSDQDDRYAVCEGPADLHAKTVAAAVLSESDDQPGPGDVGQAEARGELVERDTGVELAAGPGERVDVEPASGRVQRRRQPTAQTQSLIAVPQRRPDPGDRRARLVALTGEGTRVSAAIRAARQTEAQRLFADLDDADRDQRARILRTLRG